MGAPASGPELPVMCEGLDWAAAPPAALDAAVAQLWSTRFLTTAGIAAILRVPEAQVWNARCRLDGRGGGT